MDNGKALAISGCDQWLLWTFRDGRKVPLNKWGESSGVNRPWDFMTFDEAVAASEKLTVQGVAFVFTEDDPFYGIDLDNACEISTY
ncbi:MAG: hypothetical protein GY922_14440, partial [Proteobacteria bacterium]|nr:hypothetical protein [Pseudomonadota bacterium]